MSRSWTIWVALAITVCGAVALASAVRVRLDVAPERRAISTGKLESSGQDTAPSTSWASRSPFRRDRRSPFLRFDARREHAASDARPPAPPKPVLVLRGLVDGADVAAVIEGIPGIEGPTVVRLGDTVGPLRVRRLSPAGLVVTGLDTSWTLRLPSRGS